jgi:hypothetical protein
MDDVMYLGNYHNCSTLSTKYIKIRPEVDCVALRCVASRRSNQQLFYKIIDIS